MSKACGKIMRRARKAFKQGDGAQGRKLYHEAAKRGCQSAITLDGTPRKAPPKRKPRKRRRRS